MTSTTSRRCQSSASSPGKRQRCSRSLGYPQDPIEATGELIASIRDQRIRTIGLGRADERWFLCNAGLGMDAEIIAAMEEARSNGRAATPSRYLRTSIAQFFRGTDRKVAPLTVIRPGEDPVRGIFLAIVQNCSPWTYLGGLGVNPSPDASFDTGLDFVGDSLDVGFGGAAVHPKAAHSQSFPNWEEPVGRA